METKTTQNSKGEKKAKKKWKIPQKDSKPKLQNT